MRFGRNTLKALLSNCMGFAQTVFWLHIFGYPLTVSYPLVGAVITVPIANALLFRGIDKVLDRRKSTIILSDPVCMLTARFCERCEKETRHGGPEGNLCLECSTCTDCGWIHNCPLDHHEGCNHK